MPIEVPFRPLNTLVQIAGGGTPSKSNERFYSGNIPWVTPKDMKVTDIFTSEELITEDAIQSSAAKIIPDNSVLVVVRSGVLKHSLPVAINRVPVAINQDLKALICGEYLFPRFLLYFLKANAGELLNRVRATTADNIPVDAIRNLEIPLPPLAEQRRIAAILDHADALRAKRRAAIAKLDSLAQAIFLEMFGDPASNPRGWPVGTLRDLIATADYGTSRPASGHGICPVLRMNNITYGGQLDISNLKFMDLRPDEHEKCLVKRGDVLFNRTNSPDLVGKTTVFDLDREMAFAGYLIRIRPNRFGNSYYISGLLNSSFGKTRLRSMCKSIIGMANINAQEIQDFRCPMPPISLQTEYESAVAKIAVPREAADKSRACLDQLFAGLQHRAFHGDL